MAIIESTGVLLNNLIFDGAKIDFTRALSQNFQLNHGLTFGSATAQPTYNFTSVFGAGSVNITIDIRIGKKAQIR